MGGVDGDERRASENRGRDNTSLEPVGEQHGGKGGAGLGILDRAETPQHRNLYRQPCDLIPRLLICPPTPAIAGTVPRTYHLTYRICLHVIFFRSSMLLIVSHFSTFPVKPFRMSFHCPTRFGGVTTSVARE